MLVVLLGGCGEDDARAWAREYVDAHPDELVVVRARTDERRYEAESGDGPRLVAPVREALAPCLPLGDFDAEVVLEPGTFPWRVEEIDGGLTSCARTRLAHLPLDPPARRGVVELVFVHYRDEAVGPESYAATEIPTGAPRWSDYTPVPPWYMSAPDNRGGADWDSVEMRGGAIRFRRSVTGSATAGPLHEAEAIARRLTCPADRLSLVRTTLLYTESGLDRVWTVPETPCIEEKAREADDLPIPGPASGRALDDDHHTLLVLEVPVGPW